MNLRDENLTRLRHQSFDVLVIGAGINGAVSAASLAAKGLSVAIIDRHDFAGETSSQSSNLAWGGIKYLESYDFKLVNELCQSRNHLMKSFPSTVKEIRFLTSIAKGFRHKAPVIYAGTVLYWMFGRFVTRRPNYLRPSQIQQLEPIINIDQIEGGFEYSDCYLQDNDSRFVFNFVRRALDLGAIATNYVEATDAKRVNNIWRICLRDTQTEESFSVKSKVIINACGPFADQFNQLTKQPTQHRHLFSKGIHLVVDRLTDSHKVLAFFASDGRLFFIMPMGPKTCIGTTDVQVTSPYTKVTDADRDFILNNVNSLLKLPTPLTKKDIISERCGVRPLASTKQEAISSWTQVSRKHYIEANEQAGYISIFGGKLTDCINVGNEVAQVINSMGIRSQSATRQWYGEPSSLDRTRFMKQAQAIKLDAIIKKTSYNQLFEPLSERFWRRYGLNAFQLLEKIANDPSSSEIILPDAAYLTCEVELAEKTEMIVTLDDFLRRRSKIAMVLDKATLHQNDKLLPICKILFKEQAQLKLEQYYCSN